MSGGEYKDAVASGCGPMGDKEGILFLLTQHLPLQRALRALGHAGPTCRRAYGAGIIPGGVASVPSANIRAVGRERIEYSSPC